MSNLFKEDCEEKDNVREDIFRKSEIMKYGFYDDNHHYIVILNKEKLKEIFNADDILWEERQ